MSADPRPGEVLAGRYVVEELLGRGGMGTVWRVRHRTLGTLHALKLVRGTAGRERVQREARLQARLRHPNVVALTDVVELPDTVGLVLELVDGGTLTELLSGEVLPVDRVDQLARDLLSGVAAAHALGLVHRDLKPSNVLIAAGGVAKVADFGLAVEPEGNDRDTRTGASMGTPSYMSPEQIRDTKRVDARSDVWSLGVVLFELCTGAQLFSGPDRFSIFQSVMSGRVPALGNWRPELPDRMLAAVDAALVLDAAGRPADAAALLALWTDGERPRSVDPSPVEPAPVVEPADVGTWVDDDGPDPLPPEQGPFVGRTAELAALERAWSREAPLVMVVGPAGAGKTRLAVRAARRWVEERRGRARFVDLGACASIEDLGSALCAAAGAPVVPPDRLGALLVTLPPTLWVLDHPDRTLRTALPWLSAWATEAPDHRFLLAGREVPNDPAVVAIPLRTLTASEIAELLAALLGDPSLARHPDALRLATLLDGLPLCVELAASRVRSSSLAVVADRFSERSTLLTGDDAPTVSLRAALAESWSSASPAARATLAELAVFEGRFSPAAAEAVTAPTGRPVDELLSELVERSLVRRLPDGGFVVSRVVREFAEGHLADPARTAAEVRHGAWFARMGSVSVTALHQTALAGYVDVLPDLLVACRRAIARGDGQVAVDCLSASWRALARVGPYRTAVELGTAARALPLDSVRAEKVWMVLGIAEQWLGRMPAALACFDEAAALAEASGDRERVAVAKGHRAVVLRRCGRLDEALALYEELDATRDRDRPDVTTATDLNNHAILLTSLGRFPEAEEKMLRALPIARRVSAEELVTVLLRNLGFSVLRRGRTAEARKYFNEALAEALRRRDLRNEALLTGDLGGVDFAEGLDERALSRAKHAHQLFVRLGDLRYQVLTAVSCAELGCVLGQTAEARKAALTALVTARQEGSPAWLGFAHGAVMLVRARLGDLLGAETAAQDAWALLAEGPVGAARLTHQLRHALASAWIGDAEAARAKLAEVEGVVYNPEDRRRANLVSAALGDAVAHVG